MDDSSRRLWSSASLDYLGAMDVPEVLGFLDVLDLLDVLDYLDALDILVL